MSPRSHPRSRPTVIHTPDPNEDRHSFWCPGCERPHGFDARWSYNNDPVRPTIRPVLENTGTENFRGTLCQAYVTEGRIMFLTDCTHYLGGQTVPLPPYPSEFFPAEEL